MLGEHSCDSDVSEKSVSGEDSDYNGKFSIRTSNSLHYHLISITGERTEDKHTNEAEVLVVH